MADNKHVHRKCRLSGEEGKELAKIFETKYFHYVQKMCCIIQNKTVAGAIAGLKGYILIFDDNTYITCFLDTKDARMNWYYQQDEPYDDDFRLINFIEVKNYFGKDMFDLKEIINNGINIKKCCGEVVDAGAVGENTFNISFKNNMEIDSEIIHNKNMDEYIKLTWRNSDGV